MTTVDAIMTSYIWMVPFLELENGPIDFPGEFPMGQGMVFMQRVQVMGPKLLKVAICVEKGTKTAIIDVIMTSYGHMMKL